MKINKLFYFILFYSNVCAYKELNSQLNSWFMKLLNTQKIINKKMSFRNKWINRERKKKEEKIEQMPTKINWK